MQLRYRKLTPHAQAPVYATAQAAALDLCVDLLGYPDHYGQDLEGSDAEFVLHPGQRFLFKTGIAIELSPGYCAEVVPRSGLALKHGISIVNAPGLIDADYRGDIGIVAINHGDAPLVVTHGMRLAQLKISQYTQVELVEATALSSTERGAGGFGHTGIATPGQPAD